METSEEVRNRTEESGFIQTSLEKSHLDSALGEENLHARMIGPIENFLKYVLMLQLICEK